MFVNMLKSKIHRASVTEANLHYVGSITIDADLLEASHILPGEKVQVVNVNNGARFETYAMKGPAGGGTVCLNGAAARMAHVGDLVIIIAYCWIEETAARTYRPSVVFVDRQNRILPHDAADLGDS